METAVGYRKLMQSLRLEIEIKCSNFCDIFYNMIYSNPIDLKNS